jgi:catechol 2,3-dioxygenase-like lactoylglutathione lyase family enzyme
MSRRVEDEVKPRVSLITLAVDDLDRSVRFYRDGLGLKTPGIVGQEFENGAVAFFDLEGGTKLAETSQTALEWRDVRRVQGPSQRAGERRAASTSQRMMRREPGSNRVPQ